jgi:MFS family permease
MSSSELRRARAANTVAFLVTGALSAAWATRIPAIQEALGLSPGELGLAVLGLEGGAIVGLPTGGIVVARFGSRTGLRLGFVALSAALYAVALAPDLPALALALAVMAAATSIVDVSMNAQGVELERRYGRPVLSAMHAGHPLGLVAGGLLGVAAAAGMPVLDHFALAAALGLVLGLGTSRWLIREAPTAGGAAFIRPNRPLLALGLVAFCAFLLDGAAYNWSAVHLRSEGAGEGVAAVAFTLLSVGLAAGRLLGDRLVARFGRVQVVRGCALLAAAGAALAIGAPAAALALGGPAIPLALAGWTVFGLGLSAIAPTVLGAAQAVSDAPPSVAIAAVAAIGYLGSFSGPPVIGVLAELSTLSAALGLLVTVSAALALLAPAELGLRGAARPAGAERSSGGLAAR